ncbi:hypothetical protein NDU88_002455 [Pleurodeles waltl]|uniref:Uncharacterized protein n=1 Tax=Pleurodeles waltl TaxID=8319 RepID=A0AAV7P707_PLEWA|nr:hypothetical protein NDU88_002455 [Pleurodeles waltl]
MSIRRATLVLPENLRDDGTMRRILGIPLWKMRAEALTDPVYVQSVNEALDHYFEEKCEIANTRVTKYDAMKVVLREECVKVTYEVKMQFRHMLDQDEVK